MENNIMYKGIVLCEMLSYEHGICYREGNRLYLQIGKVPPVGFNILINTKRHEKAYFYNVFTKTKHDGISYQVEGWAIYAEIEDIK